MTSQASKAPKIETSAASTIFSEVDLDAEGIAHGFLRVPFSTNDSAFGWIPCPITRIKNGDGPTVLLMAGNHGDEFEGQVLLMKLLRSLSSKEVRGRIIILPGVNAAAVAVGERVSPLDGGNLNRLFPGAADGTPTQVIAHYIDSVLLPQSRYCFDFHSGGFSGEFVPAAHLVAPVERSKRQEAIELLKVFGMPNSIVYKGGLSGSGRLLDSCRRQGVTHMSTELGGAGTFSRQAYQMAERGLYRLLRHVGVLAPAADKGEPLPRSTFYECDGQDGFIYARASGIFEPLQDLGDRVEIGETAGHIHFTETPWREPEAVKFSTAGVILNRRSPARAKIGDCLFMLGTPVEI